MADPCLASAIALVDEALDMPIAEAVRYLFDRYRTASTEAKEAIVIALIGALNIARRGTGRATR